MHDVIAKSAFTVKPLSHVHMASLAVIFYVMVVEHSTLYVHYKYLRGTIYSMNCSLRTSDHIIMTHESQIGN